jgi:hypothetical protein
MRRYASLHDKLNGTTFNNGFGGSGRGGGHVGMHSSSSSQDVDIDTFLASDDEDHVFSRA